MRIHIKQNVGVTPPQAATPHSSGYDIVALTDPVIVGKQVENNENTWHSIDYIEYKTGVHISPQMDEYGYAYHTIIFPRSSVSKYNLILANSVGLIDNDYRGEILFRFVYTWQPEDMVIIKKSVHPLSNVDVNIIVGKVNVDKIYKKGDRLGQLVSGVHIPIEWVAVAELDDTIRGEGGWGSTGQKSEAPKERIRFEEKSNMAEMYRKAAYKEGPNMTYEQLVKEREREHQK